MDCWHHEIDRAATEAEVVQKANDYLLLWAPQELAPITHGWRELRVETAADIERIKRWLAEGLFNASSTSAMHLRELAHYFWHANIRIGEIRRIH